MGPSAALGAVFPQPALRAAQGHQLRCLFVQVSRAGLAPCQSPAHIHGDRHSHSTGPGSPTRCRTGGSSATATFPVRVNTIFLKHPNWQLGITRHKEEDTAPGSDKKVWSKLKEPNMVPQCLRSTTNHPGAWETRVSSPV